MKKIYLSIFIFAAFFLGCSRDSEVAVHFAAMQNLAEAHTGNCDELAKVLNDYLSVNEASLRKSVECSGKAHPEEARRIFEAGMSLHKQTENCKSEAMDAFRKKLADAVLQEAL